MGRSFHFEEDIARQYGDREATFIEKLFYWCDLNRGNNNNFFDGRYWSYNTMDQLHHTFCSIWTPSKLRTVITSCRKKGAVLTSHYSKDGRNRTLYYSLCDEIFEYYDASKKEKCICEKSQMGQTDNPNPFAKNDKCIIGAINTKTINNTVTYDDLFAEFWNAYPRKASKAAAQKAFVKLKPDESLLREMLNALEWQKNTVDWTKSKGQFIPYAATWLNNRRWEDEPESNLAANNSGSDETYWWLENG